MIESAPVSVFEVRAIVSELIANAPCWRGSSGDTVISTPFVCVFVSLLDHASQPRDQLRIDDSQANMQPGARITLLTTPIEKVRTRLPAVPDLPRIFLCLDSAPCI